MFRRQDKRFLLTRVTHVGVNNLPKDLSDTLTRKAKPHESGAAVLPHWLGDGLRQRAAERGYANSFEAIRASVPWRFTLVNYDMPVSYKGQSRPFALNYATFNEYTKGSFMVRREWLLGNVVNNGLHYALSGHSHRAGVYRLNNGNTNAATVQAYETSVPEDNADAHTHRHLFDTPSRTRVIVSSCGGPIGVQNVDDGMLGLNMLPPSGTLLKTDATGLDECRRIVAKSKLATPRFCVLLDYMWVTKGVQGVTWTPMWLETDARGKRVVDTKKVGQFMVVPNQLKNYVPFIECIDFCVRDKDTKSAGYQVFSSKLELMRDAECRVYIQTVSEWASMLALIKLSRSSLVLARLTFNANLAGSALYGHYSFDDPWIFPVNITPEEIIRPTGELGEVPFFGQMSKIDPDQYGYSGLSQ